MSVHRAIREAEAILPGEPSAEGEDPRWQAIIAIGEYTLTHPGPVWNFVCSWGGHPQEDLRDAIATCLLEHLFEHHFWTYFPEVETLAQTNPLFADTFLRCWQFGQSAEPESARRFESLRQRLLQRRSGLSRRRS